MADDRRLLVGRLRRAHGLKGEVTIFPLTDRPDDVLAAGRQIWVVDVAGDVLAGPVEIERSRGYHREWLVKFRGADSRDALEPWRNSFIAVPAVELPAPEGDEVYLHELAGFGVRREDGTALGVVSSLYELPNGLMIEVQGPRREFLLPYKKEFVLEVDRPARRLTVRPPEGLIEE